MDRSVIDSDRDSLSTVTQAEDGLDFICMFSRSLVLQAGQFPDNRIGALHMAGTANADIDCFHDSDPPFSTLLAT